MTETIDISRDSSESAFSEVALIFATVEIKKEDNLIFEESRPGKLFISDIIY